LDVLCLKTFRAFCDIEPYGLPCLQAAKAATLNSREMYENVFAILTADKAIPLAWLNHFTVPVSI
jgi:hypothetical protein